MLQAPTMKEEHRIGNDATGQALLQRLHEHARQRGLECLDTHWTKMNARYRLRCANGHEFDLHASCIMVKTAHCEVCRNQERMQAIVDMATAKGGQCLETQYLGSSARYRFVCAQGHKWTADPIRMRGKDAWCPHCAKIDRSKRRVLVDGLERLQCMATQRGGQCLSDAYMGTTAHYRMQCALGHQWQTTGSDLLGGSWCKYCAALEDGKRKTLVDGLERVQQAAQAKGGVCLTTAYLGSQANYQFRCSRGHEWQMKFWDANQGQWCTQCTREDWIQKTFEALREIAHARGGACLSEQYARYDVKLHWECDRGHRWYALPSSIRKGHWCAECAHLNSATRQKTKAKSRYQASMGTLGKLDF